ncbi:AMP-binding protein [Acinetobacter seifertii]|nr:AMP-binding protein [Acinetobacter seifertii]
MIVDKQNYAKAQAWGQFLSKNILVIDDIEIPKLSEKEDSRIKYDLEARQNSLNTAYIIYTSGSTGNPKGGMLAHQGIVNRLIWMQEYFSITQEDTILQKTPFGFDVSVWELFWGTLFGAKTFFAKKGGHKDPNYLKEIINDKNITIIHFVPSMLNIFLEANNIDSSLSLKHIICSGEALGGDIYNRGKLLLPHVDITNLYGPTEASIDVTCWRGHNNKVYQKIPIGKPINNTQCYILNKNRKFLPIGFSGELYLGGIQIAQGYYGKPQLTADKFVLDFIKNDGINRLYLTGDLVAYDIDYNIDFLGRIDEQVKIRGLRIELGEIEQQIIKHPKVTNAVVIAENKLNTNTILLAYFVVDDKSYEASILDEIKNHLKNVLPDYMIPTGFLSIANIPLSPNGKVSRKDLPPIDLTISNNNYEPLHTKNDFFIGRVWADLLKLDIKKISRNSNFFELGGNSLLLMQVQNKIRSHYKVNLNIKDAFLNTKLGDLSDKLDTNLASYKEYFLIVHQPKTYNTNGIYITKPSFSQSRLWFLNELDGESAHYNLAAVLKISGSFDIERATVALQRLVDRHDSLRSVFSAEDGEVLQHVYSSVTMPVDIEDWQELPVSLREEQLSREGDVSELLYRKIGFTRVGVIPGFALSSNGNYDGTAIYYKKIN